MLKKYLTLAFIVAGKILFAQIINTYAGNGISGFSGDGGSAINAQLSHPYGVKAYFNDLYISEWGNQTIRKVNSQGVISTIVGTGTVGFSGDGGPAINANINSPSQIVMDKFGNLYFGDSYNNRVRKITPSGIISTIAGTGAAGFSGDGGPAINAQLNGPIGIVLDSKGAIYITDNYNQRIRKIDTLGIITTIAGTGTLGFSGDGGPAINAQINYPGRPAIDKDDNFYFVDSQNFRVRKISTTGVITTIAGNGLNNFSGDGGPASSAGLNGPAAVDVDSLGNFFIGEYFGHRIRKVNASGIITTIAGTGTYGYSGDGGPAINANLKGVEGISLDKKGNLFLCDPQNERVRIICLSICGVGLEETLNESLNFSIYPNPNDGLFKIDIENEIYDSQLIIYNSLGQKIHEQKLTKGINEINLSVFNSGLFNYTVSQNGQIIKNGKVTIQ
ncbi:MAG: T9SS type A sorting domain-containing protein [Bacteroidia bacterium]|nr:T9SS type A sorting domain-containing protein [Bacteroidia bacterium]